MTTLIIKVPENAKSKLTAVVKELGGEVVSESSKKIAKKAKLLNEIRQGLKEVKDIEEGKSKFYSMSDLFDQVSGLSVSGARVFPRLFPAADTRA